MKRGEAKRDFANYGSWVCVYMYMFMLYAGWDGTFFFSFFTLENSFLGSFFNFPVVLLVLEWRWWMSFWTWNGTGSSLPRHGGLID